MLRISLDSITPNQVSAWRDLAAEAIEPNVFLEADFVLAAARCFPDAKVSLLVDEADGRWNGCLPVNERRLLSRPVMASGWKHLYSFLGTPLVRRGREDEFARALVGAIEKRQTGLLLAVRNFAEGPVLAAVRRAQQEAGGMRTVRALSEQRAALYVDGGTGEAIGMGKKRRKTLERRRRRLAEQLGEADVKGRQRRNDAATIEEFLRLEAASWKGEVGTAMACDERHAEFFRTVCAHLGEQGRLAIYSLESASRVAAMTCDFTAGGVRFHFKSAFDEELSANSPGILLQVDNLIATKEAGSCNLYDSCADPTNETLNAVWPDRVTVWSLVFARDDLLGRLAGRALKARGQLRRRKQDLSAA
ncbi:MAG TPA: GNAT family N-acetyltransferase [Solirubrobacterales bacterium]|jgi:CelD/BcsL family acetyltransferase involved in cellulose biosynthesis